MLVHVLLDADTMHCLFESVEEAQSAVSSGLKNQQKLWVI
jgi:hypothetical protein